MINKGWKYGGGGSRGCIGIAGISETGGATLFCKFHDGKLQEDIIHYWQHTSKLSRFILL